MGAGQGGFMGYFEAMNADHDGPKAEKQRFIAILQQFRDGMLITHATDGALHPRPMHIAKADDEGTLWLFCDLRSAKVEELSQDARASLTLQDSGRFLALSGHAEVVRDLARLEALWSEPMKVWFPDGPRAEHVALIKVVPRGGEYWDNKGMAGLTYLFEAARAYVSGKPPQLGGEHQAKVSL